jgi:hypothetical protein
MEDQITFLDQLKNFKCPPEAELRVAVQNAFDQAGPELFKAFINDYKQSVDILKQAA